MPRRHGADRGLPMSRAEGGTTQSPGVASPVVAALGHVGDAALATSEAALISLVPTRRCLLLNLNFFLNLLQS